MLMANRISVNYMLIFTLVFTLVLLVISSSGKTSSELAGYITEVNLDQQAIKIGDSWYYLDSNTCITRNGIRTSLLSCQPISGQCQWGKVLIDGETVSDLSIEYQVYEGVIAGISPAEQWLELDLFLQDTVDNTRIKRCYWQTNVTTSISLFNTLQEGDHLIVILAGNLILRILSE